MTTRADRVFENSPDAGLLIDPEQDQLLGANARARAILGAKWAILCKLPASRLFHHDFQQLLLLTQQVLHTGIGWSQNLRVCVPGDKIRNCEVAGSLLNEGETEILILTLRERGELTRRSRNAEADSLHRKGLAEWRTIETVFREFERENQLILSAAGEGIYGVDANGLTTFVNPAAERMLGWNASDLIGKEIHSTIHHTHTDGSPYPGSECHIHASFSDGMVRHVDDEIFWRKDGSFISVEYTSTPILDEDRVVGAVVIFRDISERRQAEAKLRSALEEVRQLKQRLEMENAYLQEEYRTEHNYKEIIGHSTAILQTIEQIELVAPTDANVLIYGESGTGKELIARAIHESSTRKDRPLIRVNCASIPAELFESEFFGHVRGAFTGAVNDRTGRFELADGGTLFLDEVGEIPPELQGKLLRVLQEQQFERVGDSHTRRVDVRIISATNRNLKEEVSARRFREDLYFRLKVFPIELAPLRERREDIPLLASHFLRKASKKAGKPELNISVADMHRLQSYHWPGNIRELIHLIEHAVILARGKQLRIDLPSGGAEVSAHDFQDGGAAPGPQLVTESDRHRMERENIVHALRMCNGKVFGHDGAARLLGVKPTTLTSRIKRYNINRYHFKRDAG